MKKPIQLLNYISMILCIGILSACGGAGSNYESEEASEESTEEVMEEVVEESAPQTNTAIAINHTVEDWAKWKEAFDNHDSLRKMNGFMEPSLFVSVDNPNDVHVFIPSKDHESARAFSSSEDLKSAMQEAGVTGEPKMGFLDIVEMGDGKYETMDRLLIVHAVADYDIWKTAFDEHASKRAEAELEFTGLARSNDNPNEVSVMFAVGNKEKADEFLASEEMKEVMKNAGVEGEPVFNWLTKM